ncbi:hypothetical protein L3X38_034198 [Prunus dulcis]|uniref:F-box domain-containing protein n=1 Tax=Prunus dulcis TaxID=3755 RepID=A0AAD4VHC6_PRUDU|nr:hypothetical protein L3X38_034198 [Prunus dulcis]
MTLRILHRLPVKSLIRFSCVSKQWLSTIISDPEFAKTHYNLAREQQTLSHRLLVSTQTSGLESIDLETRSFGDNSGVRRLSSPFNEPGHLRFLGSCNGLVFYSVDGDLGLPDINPLRGLKTVFHTESGTVVAICYDKNELIRIEKLENVVVTSRQYPAGEVLEEVVQYDESLLSLIEYENPTQGGNEERDSTQINEEGASTKNNEEGA